jgi:UDP-GlcNAc:undecaprenyl-phosphate GlcNAc-1-phosphate transferase
VSWSHYLLLAAIAAAVTLVVTPLVRRIANERHLVDTPGGRKVHATPIPRLGGIAIFAGLFTAIVVQWVGEELLGWFPAIDGDIEVRLLGVFGGMTLIFLVGLLDDLIDMRPGAKFAGQIAAAGVVVASGLQIDYIGNPLGGGLIQLGLLGIPLTIVYIVGFANVINLIDGLDGLAAGVSAIAGGALLVLAAQGNHLDAAVIAAALIGACVGFLRYNFNPASIFMGDSGALLLGFTLACVSLLGVMKSVATVALAVPLLIIGVPIFDTGSAIVRRWRGKRPIQEADRHHVHHRLLGRGFDQRQTVLIIYVWSIVLAVGAYTIANSAGPIRLVALVGLFGVTALMAYWLGLFEAAHYHDDDDDVVGPPGLV